MSVYWGEGSGSVCECVAVERWANTGGDGEGSKTCHLFGLVFAKLDWLIRVSWFLRVVEEDFKTSHLTLTELLNCGHAGPFVKSAPTKVGLGTDWSSAPAQHNVFMLIPVLSLCPTLAAAARPGAPSVLQRSARLQPPALLFSLSLYLLLVFTNSQVLLHNLSIYLCVISRTEHHLGVHIVGLHGKKKKKTAKGAN